MVHRYTPYEKRHQQVVKQLPWYQRNGGHLMLGATVAIMVFLYGDPVINLFRKRTYMYVDPRLNENSEIIKRKLEERDKELKEKYKRQGKLDD